jgi:ABC-type sulfate/molybdate transport systems ATPase subunit
MGLIEDLHRARQLTSIHVTHNLNFARRADRLVTLERGRLASASQPPASSSSSDTSSSDSSSSDTQGRT